MNDPQLIKMLAYYPQWVKQFQFDPTYGYLIDPNYRVISYDYQLLKQILQQLYRLNERGDIMQKVQQMPQIVVNKQIMTYQDLVILHDSCSYLIHSYIKIAKDKNIQDTNIKIPKNLSIPLILSASTLKIKTGMSTGICYNWQFINQPTNLDLLSINNIKIKYFYSKHIEQQSIFFQVSVVTSYFLSRIIKYCYEINCIIALCPMQIKQVMDRLKNIQYFLKRIFQQNLQIQRGLSKQFFYKILRIFVSGYQNIYFEGIEQKISSSGGAGGYDPSFQSFQRAFGIYFQGQLADIQKKLRNGMPQPNRQLIDFFSQRSLIRQYCQCTQQLQFAYNQTIDGYVKYLQLHGTFIKNFLINMMPTHLTRSNFGGSSTSQIISVVDKYKFVRQHKFYMNQ